MMQILNFNHADFAITPTSPKFIGIKTMFSKNKKQKKNHRSIHTSGGFIGFSYWSKTIELTIVPYLFSNSNERNNRMLQYKNSTRQIFFNRFTHNLAYWFFLSDRLIDYNVQLTA